MAVFRGFHLNDDGYLSIKPTPRPQVTSAWGGQRLSARSNPMSKSAPPSPLFDKKKVVAENRRARFDYFVEDRFEAGIQLTGTEVKSLRHGEGSIAARSAT